jgi:hypothetical protein
MGHISELFNMQTNYTTGQVPGSKKAWYGYIQQYNPQTGYCTVINPINSILPEDAAVIGATPTQQFVPTITNWIPLATPMAGLASGQNNINTNIPNPGFQYAPVGGASVSNPTGGEQVLVIEVNSDTGYSAAAFLTYNNIALPPGQAIPVLGTAMNNGEFLMVTPAGVVLYLDNNANLNIFTLQVPGGPTNGTGNVNVVSNGGIGFTTAATDTPPPSIPAGNIAWTALKNIFQNALEAIGLVAGTTATVTATTAAALVGGTTADLAAGTEANVTAGTSANITAGTTITIDAGGVISLTTTADINVLGASVQIGELAALFYPLMTSIFALWVTTHTHSGVQTGAGVSGPPVDPPTLDYPNLTSITTAN